jgi:hypothetical protein
MTVEVTSAAGAVVTYTPPTASDLVDGVRPVTCAPASGSAFALGTTTVTCTAADTAGNGTSTSFTVTVRDTTSPVISCTPVTLNVDPLTGLAVIGDLRSHATATDNSGTVTVTQQSPDGTSLAPGTHPLIFTATDPSANTASCSTTITVTSVAPPTGTLTVTPGVLWPPNHKLVTVAATITLLADPKATVKLISITSSEPDNGLGDGDTAVDIQTINGRPISTVYGTDVRSFKLRAERSGRGPGRTYTITYQLSNSSGTTTLTARVLVPRDMGGNGHFDGDGCHNNKHDGKPGDQDDDKDKDKKDKDDDKKNKGKKD